MTGTFFFSAFFNLASLDEFFPAFSDEGYFFVLGSTRHDDVFRVHRRPILDQFFLQVVFIISVALLKSM